MLVLIYLLEYKNLRLGMKTELCGYGQLALSLKVQSFCNTENHLNPLLMMMFIPCYLVRRSLSEAAITPIISVHLVMLDCMKVTNETLNGLDLCLLNHTER